MHILDEEYYQPLNPMFHKYVICSLFCFVFAGGLCFADAQERPPQDLPKLLYHFHKFTQNEGLSSYNVKRVLQDMYGYTWIATQDGLNRFDGKNITIYNKSVDSPRQIANTDIWDMAEDTATHRLWVLSYSALNCIDLSTGKVLPNPPAIAPASHAFLGGWFKCLLLCCHKLWIGAANSTGLTLYDPERQVFDSIEPVPVGPPADSGSVTAGIAPNIDRLWLDEYDRIWVFVANYGIVLYSATGKILQRHPMAELGLPANTDFDRFRAVASVGKGRMALVTNAGLFDVRYDEHGFVMKPWVLPGGLAGIAAKEMYACATDHGGALWFGANNSLYRLEVDKNRLTEIEDADYMNPENWYSGIFHIYFDHYDHLWLGTQKGLAFSPVSVSPFTTYFESRDHKVSINHANYVYPYLDSLLYVCAEDGFYTVRAGTGIIRKLADGRYFYTTRLKNGDVLVGEEHHLYALRDDKLIPVKEVYPELAPIGDAPIIGVVWCGDTLAVIGRNDTHGVCFWYPRRHELRFINQSTQPLALGSDIVNNVCLDRRNRVWILSDVTCSIFDPRKGRIDTFSLTDGRTHQPLTFYFDMAEAQGLYWLAVYGTGLVGLDSSYKVRKTFSTQQGFANSGIYKVFAWRDSLLFVTSNNGLSRIRLANSNVINYFQKDGLHGNGFEELCGFADDRYIYAGGVRGVSRIEPALIPVDPAPPSLRLGNVKLRTSASLYDIGDISAGSFTVPSDVVQATFTVFSFDYTDEGRSLLFYSIPELKTQWIPVGTDETIDLLGLSPGRYTLHVRAVNPNSSRNERTAVLSIEWLPKWYQTMWFKVLVGVVLLLLLYGFYRYRIETIRQQHLIRQNISSDLHDDIGSTLNTIKIFTHLARRGAETEKWLEQIEASLAQAVVALRDMIWVLDDSQDTVYQLLERIRQFALPVTQAHGIQLDVAAEGETAQRLLKEEKRNLLLVAKESVNNSIKYSGCSTIGIHIEADGRALALRIEDDGKGFDQLLVNGGNGLKNMSRRASRIHYQLHIDSTPGVGTRIVLSKT